MVFEMVVDVFMSIDIVICLFTTFYIDMKPETNLSKIMIHYATGNMVTDCASTITGFFVMSKIGYNYSLYWCKLLRFLHIRTVFGSVSVAVRVAFSKCGMDEKRVENIGYIMDLIIIMFSAIHILGCAWIYLGKLIVCSWLN